MKSVYAESRRRKVDTKLNRWGETTWISVLTARRFQSAPLIDRQHFDLQWWLLHGDTNHNKDINTKQSGRKRFKSSDTFHPALSFFLSPPFIVCTNPSRQNTFTVLRVCLSFFFHLPTHLFSPWMASMAVVLIVSSSPSSGSPFPPHFIHPFVDLSLLSPLQRNWVKAPLNFLYAAP